MSTEELKADREGVSEPEQVPALPQDRSLLILDDDKPFLGRLTRAMEARGFLVTPCETVAEGPRVLPRLSRTRPLSPSSTCGLTTAMASTSSQS